MKVTEKSSNKLIYEDTFTVPPNDVLERDNVMSENDSDSLWVVSIKVDDDQWHSQEWGGSGCGVRADVGNGGVSIGQICYDD